MKKNKWAGHVASKGEKRCAYMILMDKSEGKRTLGRFRCGWEGIIKISLTPEEGAGWFELAQYKDKWRSPVSKS
jgi:hypothetical protein